MINYMYIHVRISTVILETFGSDKLHVHTCTYKCCHPGNFQKRSTTHTYMYLLVRSSWKLSEAINLQLHLNTCTYQYCHPGNFQKQSITCTYLYVLVLPSWKLSEAINYMSIHVRVSTVILETFRNDQLSESHQLDKFNTINFWKS